MGNMTSFIQFQLYRPIQTFIKFEDMVEIGCGTKQKFGMLSMRCSYVKS